MGIKGLLQLIMANLNELCTPPASIKGKLVVDGCSVLHDLYDQLKLEWASGGCYADQHRKTLEYFEAMVKHDIEPIVVIAGGGSRTDIEDTIHRRGSDINDLPGQHRIQLEKGKEDNAHRLPLLARKVFVSSLKERKDIQVVVADGTVYETAVQLANYYNCPILSNKNNYCVSGISGGVIFFWYFKVPECTARIFKQTRLNCFLDLEDPDLILAVVAIMGDGNETSIPCLYHGGIKIIIEEKCKSGNRIMNVVNFLKEENIYSFEIFRIRIKTMFRYKQRQMLIENCRTAKEIYGTLPDPMNVQELMKTSKLQCSDGNPLPEAIVRNYRAGNYPAVVLDAICVGKCTLDADVGDDELPPIPQLGQSIRQVMYGLVSSLMSRDIRRGVEEYYRSLTPEGGEKPWQYAPYNVTPRWHYDDLSCDNIYDLDQSQRMHAAKQAICMTLRAPENFLSTFDNDRTEEFVLAVLTTYYWIFSSHTNTNRFCPTPQLVKALILNFFICCDSHTKQYQNPMWLKIYHSLLEWQSVYQDACGLNSMLLCPFSELSPANLLDSEFVIELALGSSDILTAHQKKMSQESQEIYAQIIHVLNI